MLRNAAEAAHTSLRTTISNAIPLQAVFVLGVFRELAQRIAGRRALWSTAEERHITV
jgi:hypothetical protein